MDFRLTGLIAATFTPMRADGSLNLGQTEPVVEHLLERGIRGMYVCGSTGEGPSLSLAERKATAVSYVRAAAGRMPVVVQVGHSSLADARDLAADAQRIGANAISAVAPYYFKPDSIDGLLDCLAQIASAAPELPFYYYHIPAITGVHIDVVEFLRRAPGKVPTLAGVKYTAPTLDELQELIELEDGRYDILHGRDEMLLSGLAVGARGAIGSTYNFAAPLYGKLIEAFDRLDLIEARRLQSQSVAMIRTVLACGGQGGLKTAMNLLGPDCGPVRLPLATPTREQTDHLKQRLESLGMTR